MPLIGLTGSIGSGKTAASDYLRSLGAYIIDADTVSREVTEPGTEGARKISERFGEEVFFSDGSLNRKKLAEIVFRDESKLKALNGILHPLIIGEMFRRAEEQLRKFPECTAVLVAPLLIETGMHEKVDEVWLITADDETRIARVMRRDGSTREQVQKRLGSQMRDEDKMPLAHVVIQNSGDIEYMYAQLRNAFYERRKDPNGKEKV